MSSRLLLRLAKFFTQRGRRPPARRQASLRRAAVAGLVAFGTVSVPTASALAHSGLYLQLGAGYASYSGTELVLFKTDDPGDIPDYNAATCCASPGVAAQVRAGYSFFGFGGPEFMFLGSGFNGFQGGSAFVGGGVRAFPLRFISLTGLDTSEFPLTIGLGAALGYTMVGKDFAYTGSYWNFDVSIEYKFGSLISAGLRFDLIAPAYSDFVLTDYNKGLGRCLDQTASHDVSNFPTPMPRESAQCAGRGPSTTFLAPQLVITFHHDFLSP